MPELPNPKLRDVPPPEKQAGVSSFAYAELDVKTNFSFLRGASHPDELVYRAAELGYRAVAVTDFNSLAGVVRAHEAAKESGISLLIGARLTLSNFYDLLVWAPDRTAYARLCRLLTLGKRRAQKGQCALELSDFLDHGEGLLAAVVTASSSPVNSTDIAGHSEPAAASQASALSPAPGMPGDLSRREGPYSYGPNKALGDLKNAMGDRLSLAASCAYGPDDATRLAQISDLSRRFGIPLLATNDVYYHDPTRRMLHDVVTCVRHGCTIRQAGFRLFPNGERHLKSPERMHRLFADYPGAIRRGLEIAERCTFKLDELRYEYPDELSPPGKTTLQYLRELTWVGAAARYPAGVPEKVRRLVDHELALIEQLRFEHYFLTVYDVVTFARSRGILCQGRGSAANSAVCYCLGVTSVDPDRIDVLFERFISAARGEPPDIDVDFEHERREEVLQYLYEKYGRERAAMTGVVITYRGRSAVRDVGKAMGLSLDMVDSLAGKLDWWHKGVVSDEQIRETGLDPADRTIGQVMALATDLLGFPRHLSQHVGGMVMTRGPLCEMVPIENATMEDRTVIEWDKDDIDAIGILKVDVLALGMLTCISKTLAMVNRHRETCAENSKSAAIRQEDVLSTKDTKGHQEISLEQLSGCSGLSAFSGPACGAFFATQGRFADMRNAPGHCDSEFSSDFGFSTASFVDNSPLELHTVPPEDPDVYDMISNADTVGVFQVESRAQMSMLPRLRPRCFYDLVIEVAIVRPGPIQGDMVHPYLRRRAGMEPVTFPSEPLRQVLEKTLGVPLFQEQAMRVAMVGAGFTAEEADKLRRVMAAWRRTGAIEKFHAKIVDGMLKNGYTLEFAEQCFNQIKGFGEYGFPESHSASFALLVYVSAWLKRHHPAAFAASLLNSQPMGFYMPAQIVRDAKEHGVPVRAADVNASEWDCTLEYAQEDCGERPARSPGTPGENLFRPLNQEPPPYPSPGVPGEGTGNQSSIGDKSGMRPPLNISSAQGEGLVCTCGKVLGRRDRKDNKIVDVRPEENALQAGPLNEREMIHEGHEGREEIQRQIPSSPCPSSSSWISPLPADLAETKFPQWGAAGPALRLGFRELKGFRQNYANDIVAARKKIGRFTSIPQFHRLAGLPASAVRILAEADAFGSLGLSRRDALWHAMKLKDEYYPLFDGVEFEEPPVKLPTMPVDQEVMTDYATAGLSLKRHPVSLVRDELRKRRIITAADLAKVEHNRWVKVAGLVLIRQRPGTASGVVFETLEDETGVINLIVHPAVYDRYRPAARHAGLLQADGYVQRQGQIVHVLPKRLIDLSELIGDFQQKSRDFH